MTESPSSAVASITFDPDETKYPVLFAENGEGSVAQVLEDNFGDEGFSPADLDRVKIPSGGGTAWEVPDEDPSRAIEGVVIHHQQTRSMWFKGRGEGGEEDGPPDCTSLDGKVGIGAFGPGSEDNPAGECAACPMNVFGSSDRGSGEGKACKEQRQLFLLREGAVLPLQISLPPTSLKGWRKYMARLSANNKSFMAVVTRLTLEVAKANGQTFSVVVAGRARDLHPVEAQASRAYGSTIKSFIEQSAKERTARAAIEGPSSAAAAVAAGEDKRGDVDPPASPASSADSASEPPADDPWATSPPAGSGG